MRLPSGRGPAGGAVLAPDDHRTTRCKFRAFPRRRGRDQGVRTALRMPDTTAAISSSVSDDDEGRQSPRR